jgi:hypothetical protein
MIQNLKRAASGFRDHDRFRVAMSSQLEGWVSTRHRLPTRIPDQP